MARKNPLPDLGEKLGKLTVSAAPWFEVVGKFGQCRLGQIPCRCECGAEVVVSLSDWAGRRKQKCPDCTRPPGPRPGDRLGGWTLVKSVGGKKWEVRCDCGVEAIKSPADIRMRVRQGKHPVCWACSVGTGKRRKAVLRHGMVGTREYCSWASMLHRCRAGKLKSYRDVRVCARWDPQRGGSFENFFADLGWRPPNTTLDRIDPTGHYEPTNVRWASPSEQVFNRRPHLVNQGGHVFLWGGKRESSTSLLDSSAETSQN